MDNIKELSKTFVDIFGSDILTKEFDAEIYRGYVYITLSGNCAYILEVRFVSDDLRLVKFPKINKKLLFDLLIKSEAYNSIGYVYVKILNNKKFSEEEKIKKILEVIYNNGIEWLLEDYILYDVLPLENEFFKFD